MPTVGKDVKELELSCMVGRWVFLVIPGLNDKLVTGCYSLPFGSIRKTSAPAVGLTDMSALCLEEFPR